MASFKRWIHNLSNLQGPETEATGYFSHLSSVIIYCVDKSAIISHLDTSFMFFKWHLYIFIPFMYINYLILIHWVASFFWIQPSPYRSASNVSCHGSLTWRWVMVPVFCVSKARNSLRSCARSFAGKKGGMSLASWKL